MLSEKNTYRIIWRTFSARLVQILKYIAKHVFKTLNCSYTMPDLFEKGKHIKIKRWPMMPLLSKFVKILYNMVIVHKTRFLKQKYCSKYQKSTKQILEY